MKTIDLRSDTVTRPTGEMRRAMAEAEVGDDVYGEDPTVNRLEEEAAEQLGFEAALFVPTGTMGNEIAIRLHTRPTDLVLAEERSHVVQFELAGMAALSGVAPLAVSAPRGHLTPDHILAAQRTRVVNRPEVALVVLENTANLAGGTVADVALMRATMEAAHAAGFLVHVDGARIWNAAVALDVQPREIVAGADSVMACLSKGLAAPVGSLLFCTKDRARVARRHRQLFGGGMRQAGVLAAAGRVALNRMRERLAEDHANARVLFDALAICPGVQVVPPETNIVVAELQGALAAETVRTLAGRGVLAGALGRHTLRLVTHNDATRDDCNEAASVIREVLAAG